MSRTPAIPAMSMPPRTRIEAALRLATERFATELALPSGQAPEWSDFQWAMARAAAVMHGVTPLLADISGWRQSREWAPFATQQRYHTLLRRRRLADAVVGIDQQAQAASVALMALKGSALHALGLYRDGERPMADLDLLVAPHEATQVRGLLEALGFQEVARTWKHWVFEAPTPSGEADPPYGEHASAALKIELHQHIAERLPVNKLDITAWIWPNERHPGINPYPSMAALMSHLLLHAAGNMAGLGLRLIQVHDLALLVPRMHLADWDALLELRIAGQPPWWALPPLELVARYYPERIRPDVLATLRSLCPRGLRTRARRQTISDVSFCSLSLQAFPGLAWAVSLSDKLGYLRTRIRPDQDIIAQRAAVNRESWAAGNAWRQRSQARQVLHWLLVRPLRREPMYLVRAAIADQATRAGQPPRSAGGCDDAVQMP